MWLYISESQHLYKNNTQKNMWRHKAGSTLSLWSQFGRKAFPNWLGDVIELQKNVGT